MTKRVATLEETENAFMLSITDYAELLGYIWSHTPNSKFRRLSGTPGSPDLFLFHPTTGAVLWAEVKKKGGRQSEAQYRWQSMLKHHGHECWLWYPHDLDDIKRILNLRAGRKAA